MMNIEKNLMEIYPWMLNSALKYPISKQNAEDLVSDVICKILVNRDKFDWNRALKPWCLVIMRNTYITSYNKKLLIDFISYDVTSEIIDSSTSEDLILRKDTIAIIRQHAYQSININCLTYLLQGYSYIEISNFLNIPINTVKTRIHYGRKQLRKILNY